MRLRQLPQIYLRGALAHETMRHMPKEDQDRVNDLMKELTKSPILAGHRNRFIEKLSHTIGGDYHYKSKAAADQEFQIALWRAVVYLLYHTEYSYRCEACGNMAYKTQRGKPHPMDRRYPVCPECEAVRIDSPGDSYYRTGDFVKLHDLQKYLKTCDGTPPTHTSPVTPIRGTKKVSNHAEVLSSSDQLAKFMGEFIWNYFRQTLRENEIKMHQKEARAIEGPADMVAVEEIVSKLTQEKVVNRYERKGNPLGGYYHVIVDILATTSTVSRQIRILIEKYEKYGVPIVVTDTEILVGVKDDAECISANVITPQPVCMQGRTAQEEEDDVSVVDIYHHKIKAEARGMKMQEDGIAQVESEDLLDTIRSSLNDGAQKVFDIMMCRGDIYDDFIEFQSDNGENPVDRPPASHIASFLNIGHRQVTGHIDDIKLQCYAHGLGEGC